MKTNKFFLAALTVMCAMTMTTVLTSCTNDDNPVTKPIEYGKVFNYTYEGKTLFYVIDEASQTATLVAPLYPDYPKDEILRIDGWQGYEKPKGSVTIPESVEYGGKRFPMTALGEGAFSLCSDISNVKLPEGITAIGPQVFDNCTGLKAVNLPNCLTSIEKWAFADCKSLSAIELPESLTAIGSNCFNGDESLTAVTIPSNIETVSIAAFANCTSLTTVNLPEGLTAIEDYAFSSCYSLSEINLPKGLTTIGNFAFDQCI